MSLDEKLSAALARSEAHHDSETLPAGAGWRPETLEDVNWGLGRMGALEEAMAENKAMAEKQIVALRERLEAINAPLEQEYAYREAQIQAFAKENREKVLRAGGKSRKLLNGSVAWRKTGGRLVRDEGPEADAALLAWAKAQGGSPQLVRTKEEPAWTEIQKFCAPEMGAAQIVPPGTHWEDVNEYGSLTVTPAETALVKTSGL